jgi:hypothetical protein
MVRRVAYFVSVRMVVTLPMSVVCCLEVEKWVPAVWICRVLYNGCNNIENQSTVLS